MKYLKKKEKIDIYSGGQNTPLKAFNKKGKNISNDDHKTATKSIKRKNDIYSSDQNTVTKSISEKKKKISTMTITWPPLKALEEKEIRRHL